MKKQFYVFDLQLDVDVPRWVGFDKELLEKQFIEYLLDDIDEEETIIDEVHALDIFEYEIREREVNENE